MASRPAFGARGAFWLALIAAGALAFAGLRALENVARSAVFLAALSEPTAHDLGDLIEEIPVEFESSGGPVIGRLYRRVDAGPSPGVVVAHGIHYQGIDEARLVPFVRHLASSGLVVLTPELEDLADYRVTDTTVAVLRSSVDFLTRSPLVSREQVGLLGFSFAGGLSLVAAAEPGVAQKLRYVASVGGHHDLRRVLQFYVSNEVQTPEGVTELNAHEYGLVVLAYSHVEQLVPVEDVDVMRSALRAWLQEDRDAALAWASQRTSAEADELFALLREQGLGQLRDRFERILSDNEERLAALSPRGNLSGVQVPVYLLHGKGDTVIPPSETQWADAELTGQEHGALVTPLIQHVEVASKPLMADKLELVWFMSKLM